MLSASRRRVHLTLPPTSFERPDNISDRQHRSTAGGVLGNDPSHLEGRIEHIVRRLDEIERRLHDLEASPRPAAPQPRSSAASALRQPVAGPAPRSVIMPAGISLALIGRTLVVLGGAFLLRAITESEVVSLGVGTSMGLLYAVLWIAAADRNAAQSRASSAGFHGLAASIIAFPLIWESTVRFDLLRADASAALLIALTGAGVAVAWRRALRGLAWILMLGNATTAIALAFVTKAFMPYMIDLLALALATVWLGYVHDWRGLAGVTAVVTNIAVLLISTTLFLIAGDESRLVVAPLQLMLLQLTLLLVYVGSVTGRVLARRRDVGVLESLQSVAVMIIGLGGAMTTLRQTGEGRELLTCVVLGLALGGYAVVFSIIDKRVGARANFIFFSTLALVFTIVGSSAIATGTALVLVLGGAALLTTWIGASKERATLSLHGAVYALSAAGVAEVMGRAAHAFWGPAAPNVPVTTSSSSIVLAIAAVCIGFRVAMHGPGEDSLASRSSA